MKKVKKVFALLLSMAMILALCSTTFAATPSDTSSATRTITVSGEAVSGEDYTSASSGFSVKAYQIIKANYSGPNGAFSNYSTCYTVDGFTVSAEGTITLTEQIMADVWEAIEADDDASPYTMAVSVADGTWTATATVPVGSYLVVVSGSESVTYSLAVVSVSYMNDEDTGELTLVEGDVSMPSSSNSWVKAITPTVEKDIIEGDDEVKGDSVNIGDEVNYIAYVRNIPTYLGEYPEFYLDDKLDGLEMTSDELASIVITAHTDETDATGTVLTKDVNYKVTSEGTASDGNTVEFKIDFVVNGEYQLNDYAGGYLTVTYAAIVTSTTHVDDEDDPNDIKLVYATTSFVRGSEGEDEDVVHSYTFDIDGTAEGSVTRELVRKTGETDSVTEEKTYLDGAGFTLYTDEDCTIEYSNDTYTEDGNPNSQTKEITTATVDDKQGYLSVSGLEAGTYYLKETTAPHGYALNTTVYKIVIDATINKDTGLLQSWSVTITDTSTGGTSVTNTFAVTYTGETITETVTSNDGEVVTTEIQNTSLVQLPSTGGIGTMVFTIVGCLIIVLAAALFFVYRRRANNR